MATFFAWGYRDELLQHRKKLRENPRVQEDVDHAWMALNLCVLEKKASPWRQHKPAKW
jgi:hypothetical protein